MPDERPAIRISTGGHVRPRTGRSRFRPHRYDPGRSRSGAREQLRHRRHRRRRGTDRLLPAGAPEAVQGERRPVPHPVVRPRRGGGGADRGTGRLLRHQERQERSQRRGGGNHHQRGGCARGHLPADRDAGPGRGRARPPRPRGEDRQLSRRPALGRPQPGRHRVRGAGGGRHHPAPGGVPVPRGSPGRRPPVGAGARRRHPLPAVGPAVRPRRRDRSGHRPARLRTADRRQPVLGRPGLGHHPAAGAGGAVRHLRHHRLPVGVQSFGQQASGAHLPLHVGAARGSGGRFGGQRPHPVLLDIRRDLDVESVGGLRAVLRRVARHAARRRRRPRRPTS